MKQMLFWLAMLIVHSSTIAQSHIVSGHIKDEKSGEPLIGAIVIVKSSPQHGAATDIDGFYSIKLPPESDTLLVSYAGYVTAAKELRFSRDTTIDIRLLPSINELREVVVKSERDNSNVSSVTPGTFKLELSEIKTVPVLFGEKDVMKVIQMTPGVKSTGDGSSGFYVRGGSADQNLVLLDGAPVYNPSHMLGFFSVFNSDVLKDVSLYKGGIPAAFGGRGSSVLNMNTREGSLQKTTFSGGIGTISSRLAVEGPLKKDKGSFIVAARRTYADVFLNLSEKEDLRKSRLYFYDVNAKAHYKLTDKDRVYLSAYYGQDVFALHDKFGTNWGNATGTLRWSHVASPKLFANTSLIFSNNNNKVTIGSGATGIRATSGLQDLNLKYDVGYIPNSSNKLKFGTSLIYHNFKPGSIDAGKESSFNTMVLHQRKAVELGIYVQNEMQVTKKVSATYGVRYSGFSYIAKDSIYLYSQEGQATNTIYNKNWSSVAYYGGFEPRASVNYLLNETSSVKTSFNRINQYLHLLASSTTSSPFDQWIPSTNNVKPQIVDQISLGYFRNFSEDMFELSTEVYHKNMQNQVEYRPGAELVFNSSIEKELVYGYGRAYGADFLLRKQKGNLTGWIGYTLSKADRKFNSVDNGNIFPARQDRLHDLSIVTMYKLSEKIHLSANWVYNTGNAVTFPSGRYTISGVQVPIYTDRNGYRMKDYHRLDIGITWYRKNTEKTESSWNFSLYNAYGRENPYAINFRQNKENPDRMEAVQTTLFRWVPSISYNFKF